MSFASARSRRMRSPTALATALAAGALGGALLIHPLTGCSREAEAASAEADPVGDAADHAIVDYDPRKSLAPMIEAVGPAVVSVYAEGVKPPGAVLLPGMHARGTGSGFVIDAEGLVVTNNHVVDGASKVEVRLPDGRRYDAEILGRDPATDLALLRLSGAEGLPTVELGTSAELAVGDWVVAVGNPMGLEHSATVGIVSGKGRGSLGLYADSFIDFLQTDADIAPGSSGGPLFDLKGRVIGINTAVGAGGPGFAIPIDQATRVLQQLRDGRKVARGWLGAASVPGEENGVPSGAEEGARIGKVFANTPAAKAGLRPGDLVTAVDGERVGGFNELRGRIATTDPGTEVELSVKRGTDALKLRVLLTPRPEGDSLASLQDAEGLPQSLPPADARPEPRSKHRGFDRFFAPLLEDEEATTPGADADARPRLGVGVRETAEGLQVVSVTPGSLADKLGLREGDDIIEIGGQPVKGAADVHAALGKSDRRISVVYLRDGARHEASYESS